MNSPILEKQLAARHAVRLVQDGMRVGLGSGSTAALAIEYLGERVRSEGLKIEGVPTSPASRALAVKFGVPLAEDNEGFELDLAIDGADELTRAGDLIKGGGGALFHERIVAAAAKQFVVIADSSKVVEELGTFPLPVEVSQFGWRNAMKRLDALGCKTIRREKCCQPFSTAEGNFIIDCAFASIKSTGELDRAIHAIPGVVDHGLFLGMAHLILIGRGDTVEEIRIGE
jgi:ribose 5-phosphate isomerase A